MTPRLESPGYVYGTTPRLESLGYVEGTAGVCGHIVGDGGVRVSSFARRSVAGRGRAHPWIGTSYLESSDFQSVFNAARASFRQAGGAPTCQTRVLVHELFAFR